MYLRSLAQGTPSPVAVALLRDKGWDRALLQDRAQAVLSNILHQYARFSVSTIDSFFQKIIRGFSQELGLQNGFLVELDQHYVLNTIIDCNFFTFPMSSSPTLWYTPCETSPLSQYCPSSSSQPSKFFATLS